MTVQQEQRVAVLPGPRTAADDEAPAAPAPVRRPGEWATPEDRLVCRWMMVGMLVLGLYASLFVWLGARVFG